MASLSEMGSVGSGVGSLKCSVKSVGENGGVLLSRLTLAITLEITPLAHSVLRPAFNEP